MLTKATQKLIRSLDSRKGRRKEGLFVAEGPKLVGEMWGHFECVRLVATALPAAMLAEATATQIPVDLVSDEELRQASLLQTPQQMLALFRIPEDEGALADVAAGSLCLALDGVQDPGNLGTIVRVADWFGVRDIWCSVGTADIWNPKAVQATMGGLSRVRVHYINLSASLRALPTDVPVYGTSLSGESLWTTTLQPRGVVVMGNEGNGVSGEVDALCSKRLLIPNYPAGQPTTESLNVAMATGIVLAEFCRQQLMM
ncbi:MAG: RNA methyltransferase [Bacteroidaceae bacterium]|nr:RNA methyltransferase [Bacteroidaceae bacterium]